MLYFLGTGTRDLKPHDNREELLKILRLLIRYCDIDVCRVITYSQRDGAFTEALNGVLHNSLSVSAILAGHLFEKIQMLLQHGCELEEQDAQGSTPLLHALYFVPDPELVSITNLLLKAGANPFAVNHLGQGCLHHLLDRLSACTKYDTRVTEARAITDLLITLLKKGCSPHLQTNGGYTPSDYALSPTGWALWCNALRETGFNIATVLEQDDIDAGVSYSDSDEIGRLYNAALARKKQRLAEEPESITAEIRCYRCTQGFKSWPPFDFLGSFSAYHRRERPRHCII